MNEYGEGILGVAILRDYCITSDCIRPTTKDSRLIDIWEHAAESLRILTEPVFGKILKRPPQRREFPKIHLEFASCTNPEEVLEWVKKYGFPYGVGQAYKGVQIAWWNDEQPIGQLIVDEFNINDKRLHLDGQKFNINEFLFWAKIASWILQTGTEYKNNPSFINDMELTLEVKQALVLMEIEEVPLAANYVLPRSIIINNAHSRILNTAMSKVTPHIFKDNSNIFWGWRFSNMLQFVFLNILSEITTAQILPMRCKCGRWFTPVRPDRATHCSTKCQERYKKQAQRKRIRRV